MQNSKIFWGGPPDPFSKGREKEWKRQEGWGGKGDGEVGREGVEGKRKEGRRRGKEEDFEPSMFQTHRRHWLTALQYFLYTVIEPMKNTVIKPCK
jgi:hypothetical protein